MSSIVVPNLLLWLICPHYYCCLFVSTTTLHHCGLFALTTIVACMFPLILLWLICHLQCLVSLHYTVAYHSCKGSLLRGLNCRNSSAGTRNLSFWTKLTSGHWPQIAVRPAQSGNEAKARPKAGGDFRDAGCTKVPGLLQAEPTERGRTSS